MNNTSSSIKNIFNHFDMNTIDLNTFFMNHMKNGILENDTASGILEESNKKIYTKLGEISKKIINIEEEHLCVCEKCLKKFKTKEDLKYHYQFHLTSKTFHCEYINCGKIYKSKENLVLHIKNIHLKLKPYRCRFCDSSFSHRNGKNLE